MLQCIWSDILGGCRCWLFWVSYYVQSLLLLPLCVKVMCLCLIWFFTAHQQSFSYVGTGLPGLNQYQAIINVSCTRTQRNDAGEAPTHGPSVSIEALYHWTPALPVMCLILMLWYSSLCSFECDHLAEREREREKEREREGDRWWWRWWWLL